MLATRTLLTTLKKAALNVLNSGIGADDPRWRDRFEMRRVQLLNAYGLWQIATSFPGLFVLLQQGQLAYAVATTGITLAALGGIVALRRGVSTDRVAILHVTTLYGTFLGGLYFTGGLRSPLTSQCLLVIAYAGIVLGKCAMIVCTGIFLVSTVALYLAERQGSFHRPSRRSMS